MRALILPAAIYFLIWWLVWFAVLPWGVRRQDEVPAGHDPGAPVRPFIAVKLIATTLIAAALMGIGYALWALGILSIERLPMPFELPRR